MLAPEVIAEAQRRLREALKGRKPVVEDAGRLNQLRTEVGHLGDAIATGGLRNSPTLASRLADAEAEMARLTAKPSRTAPASVADLMPHVAAEFISLVEGLERAEELDIPRARNELAGLLDGEIRVRATPTEIQFITKKGHTEAALLRAVGGADQLQIMMVAGARFCAYLEIPLG